MRVVAQAFSLQKAGNAPAEYEDAYWPEGQVDVETSLIRLAVADGATETSFSGAWAKILAEAYGEGHLGRSSIIEELVPLQERWHQQFSGKPLPWYAEEKLRSGAYATLAGLELQEGTGEGRWTSFAVGDSCIVHVRGDDLLQSFPLEDAEQFDSRPLLISSNKDSNRQLDEAVMRTEGAWKSGDLFYLMTDALACYFLRLWKSSDDRRELLSIFNDLECNDGFAARVNAEREQVTADISSQLRNDDVTLIRCRVGGQ